MEKHWPEVTEVCETLAYMVKDQEPIGFEVYFTVASMHYTFKHTRDLEKMLREKRKIGTTYLNLRLNNILWASDSRFSTRARPMHLYILTESLWYLYNAPEFLIKRLVHKLMKDDLYKSHLMIQFITFRTGDEIDLLSLEHLSSHWDLPPYV